MKKTKLNLLAPINKAIDMVTSEMTAALRSRVIIDGWNPDDAASIVVDHAPSKLAPKTRIDKFSAKYSDTQSSFETEFGTETTSPKATMRKFMNDSSRWERRTAKLIERRTFR